MTGSVVAYEKVTVPAGTFDTYKIVIDLKYSGSSNSGGFNVSGSIEDTLWRAPQVKSYVKRVSVNSERRGGEAVRELVKYNVQ